MPKAQWTINDYDDLFSLQIELGNDHAVTLGISKNGDPPSVVLWCGNGEHSFVPTECDHGETLQSFKAWIDCALGKPCAVGAVFEALEDPKRH